MKSLVLWCRWHDARLRLYGRNETAVWGELVFPDESKPFHFELATSRLIIGEGHEKQHLKLDEMGVEVADDA